MGYIHHRISEFFCDDVNFLIHYFYMFSLTYDASSNSTGYSCVIKIDCLRITTPNEKTLI